MQVWKKLAIVLFIAAFATQSAEARQRYFYCHNGQAYYCQQPEKVTVGCYAVCEDSSVVKIEGFPTITPQLCEQKVLAAGTPTMTIASAPRGVDSVLSDPDLTCCSGTPGDTPCTLGHECPHQFPDKKNLQPCHCLSEWDTEDIKGEIGKLNMHCEKVSFYAGIGRVNATVPVPQICRIESEEYRFKSTTISFDCNAPGMKEADCDDVKCKTFNHCQRCELRACEICQRASRCVQFCELKDRMGEVVIAVRRGSKDTDPLRADVVIGYKGNHNMDLHAYPENMVLLQNATEEEIKNQLKLPALSLQKIVDDSKTTNLKGVIDGSDKNLDG